MVTVEALIAACGLPSAMLGLFLWWFKRNIEKKEKKKEEKEKKTEDLMLLMMETNRANTVLCTAIAKAVQRIPDAHCNGDMTKALEVVEKANEKEKKFLLDQGVKYIFE